MSNEVARQKFGDVFPQEKYGEVRWDDPKIDDAINESANAVVQLVLNGKLGTEKDRIRMSEIVYGHAKRKDQPKTVNNVFITLDDIHRDLKKAGLPVIDGEILPPKKVP